MEGTADEKRKIRNYNTLFGDLKRVVLHINVTMKNEVVLILVNHCAGDPLGFVHDHSN